MRELKRQNGTKRECYSKMGPRLKGEEHTHLRTWGLMSRMDTQALSPGELANAVHLPGRCTGQ